MTDQPHPHPNRFRGDLGVTSADIILGLTTFCFDISVLEIFLPLTSGAQLLLVSTWTQRDARLLARLLR